MEYILNKTPIRTTSGFRINDIRLDLDIPSIKEFKDIDIKNIEYKSNRNGNKIDTGIGISYDKSYEVNIDIDKVYEDNIYINYDFSNDDILVSKININYFENSKANIIMVFRSKDSNKHINHINLEVNSKINSNGNISIINLLNNNSYDFIDIDSNIDGMMIFNIIDIGSNIKVSRLFGNNKSKCILNNIYIGNNDIIDTNYYIKNMGSSTTLINSEGVLNGNSIKSYKGIIDFISGASKSIGREKENVVLLSDKAISKSLPMLLCGEEDVEGSHGVSTGKIDKDKLFYLMSRGLNKKESEKLIIEGNFSNILKSIPDKNIVDEILEFIDKKV